MRRAVRLPETEGWTRVRAIVVLRLTLVVATAYLILAHSDGLRFEPVTGWLLLVALASNIPFRWLPQRILESLGFGACLVILDTLWITALLQFSGRLDVNFFVVYFLVLLVAAISENLALMTVGTVVISLGYLYSVHASAGAGVALSPETLIRLPFFVAGAALYGFLANEVRGGRRAAEDLVNAAHRDHLTDLANRRTLDKRLQIAVSHVVRTGRSMAFLVLDLDDFKYVNDTHGHDVGDEFLVAIAGRLKRHIRAEDTLARLGGDEFAIILTEFDNIDAVATVARRIKEMVAEPVRTGGIEIASTATIGIAVLSGGDGLSVMPRDRHTMRHLGRRLMTQADRALYRAKQGGKNSLSFYDEDIDREATMRAALAAELKGVLDRQELELKFQPQVDISSGVILGAEALLRWRHPGRGPVPPDVFIPVAESTGQIQEIGRWVLETACEEAARWLQRYPAGLPVAVNLSAVQFRDPHFSRQVTDALEASGLPPQLLELELTEGVLLRTTPEVKKSLHALHDDVGVGISLDDFGRGFSSLEYLCRFPIDKLKVDQFFVSAIEDPENRIIVSAILALASGLGLAVVAEGVENERQLAILSEQGCKAAQGFYYSEPLSGDELTRLLSEGSERIRPLTRALAASRVS